jgi:hypothetical protein
MKQATKRSILRWIHLVCTIPTLGYVYGLPSEVEQYATGVRLGFIPIIVLSGYWMYAGVSFAIIGVAVWLGVYHLFGYGAVILSQAALLIGRKVYLVIREKKSKRSSQ